MISFPVFVFLCVFAAVMYQLGRSHEARRQRYDEADRQVMRDAVGRFDRG